jgi:valyl-tRNA synthetase
MNKYGTDALRYTLIREVAGAGQDIRLEYDRDKDESPSVQASRNFANKLWNAARFAMMNLDGQTPQQLGQPAPELLELCDRWILSRYHQTVKQTRESIDRYGLGEAAKGLYEFTWGDFCDWYIELVKSRLQGDNPESRRVAQQTLAGVLDGILKLFHPFMPHITEEIWHTLSQAQDGETLALQAYPEAEDSHIDTELETEFDLIIAAVRTIRNLRAEVDIKPKTQIEAILQSQNPREREILAAGEAYLQDLAGVETSKVIAQLDREPEKTIAGVVGTVQVLVPLAGVVDIDQVRTKIEKSLAKVDADVKSLQGRLQNQNFVSKAPTEIVQGARDNLAEAEKQAEILRERLKRF